MAFTSFIVSTLVRGSMACAVLSAALVAGAATMAQAETKTRTTHDDWTVRCEEKGVCEAVQAVAPLPATALGRPRLARREIIRRALARLDVSTSEALRVSDLCQAAGVSNRTLQTAFLEHFGLSPHRFLMLRRMRAIHQALQAAGPSDTVAQICGRFGVWDFGRFSSAYRRIYGEFPSRVLSQGRPKAAA